MKYEYKEIEFPVFCIMQDNKGYLRPSGYLNIFQQVAALHSEDYDLGNVTLLANGKAWVVSKNRVKILKNIKDLRYLRCIAWPELEKNISTNRDYKLFCGDELIAKGISKWCILDMNQKMPIRLEKNMFPNEYLEEKAFDDEFLSIKTEEFDTLTFLEDYKIYSYFCDLSKHLNNANYMEFVFDALHLQNEYISEFQIDYINQCYEGKILSIYKKDLGSAGIYVCGYSENTLIFKSIVFLKELEKYE